MHQSIFSCAHTSPPPVHFRALGSFNSDDGKGSENVFTKMNLHFSNFVACIQTIVLLLMSSSSLDGRRVVDCKSSPFGLVLGSTHDIILWEMLTWVNPYLLDLAGKGLMPSPWGSLPQGAHTIIRC